MTSDRPSTAYRYLDSKWGPRFWEEGLIGISTTRSVAEIEGPQRDEADAAIALTLSHQFAGAVEDEPEALAAAQRMGISLTNCPGAVLKDARFESQQPGYMICMSTNPDSSAFPGKEWVFQITEVDAFAFTLVSAANGALPGRWYHGPVRYEQRTFDAREGEDVHANPFVKAAGKGYEDEEEFRLFWPTAEHPERLNILCPEALQLVRLIRKP